MASWATVLGTAAWVLKEYQADPALIVKEWTLLVFGVVVAGCLTLARGPMLLRAWHVAVFGGVSAACAVSLWVDAMIAYVEVHEGGGVLIGHWGVNFPSVPGIDTTGAVPLSTFATFAAVVVWLQYRVDAGVRRRLRAYAWVVVATYALVRIAYISYLNASQLHWADKVPLTIGQWLAMIMVPPVTFGIGVIVVRRKDSRQRLIEIGRAHS